MRREATRPAGDSEDTRAVVQPPTSTARTIAKALSLPTSSLTGNGIAIGCYPGRTVTQASPGRTGFLDRGVAVADRASKRRHTPWKFPPALATGTTGPNDEVGTGGAPCEL